MKPESSIVSLVSPADGSSPSVLVLINELKKLFAKLRLGSVPSPLLLVKKPPISLWFSHSAYIYLFVSFIQMLKALMSVAVYSNDVLFKKRNRSRMRPWPACFSISFSVTIAAYGGAKFTAWGITLQLLISPLPTPVSQASPGPLRLR